ncbi:tRNA(Glu)-specific nuclease WapA [Thalassocella blandensis]|nr:tRNA(Glu)-specific nuclease WapA [Thalassocella blandensis]
MFDFLRGALLTAAIFILCHPAYSQQTIVGALEANFSITSGTANYSIPISVAPGRAGMQPPLSLDYSSSAGNGLLGSGWGLGGISAISRCPATMEQDGFYGSIDFDKDDRYCLDGQRLVPIQGQHGDPGTEYRTEIDSYSQIISYGGTPHHPQYFVVRTKAGQTMTYGSSGNASYEFPQGTLRWSIDTISDSTTNNHIQYYYTFDNNAQYIQSISYPGGRVYFEYEERTDVSQAYIKGNRIETRKRLHRIETFVSVNQNETKRNEYLIDYEEAKFNQPSLVSHVTLCAANSDCIVGVNYLWQTLSAEENDWSLIKAGIETSIHFSSTSSAQIDMSRMQTGDFNGDGLTDIYHIRGYDTSEVDKIYLSKKNGDFDVINGVESYVNDDKDAARIDIARLKFVDFNGDGKTDIYRMDGWMESVLDTVFLSNGDGSYETIAGVVTRVSKVLSDTSRVNFGDFNGDGLTDIYVINGWGTHGQDDIFLSDGNGHYTKVTGLTSFVGDSKSKSSLDIARLKFADFNGDGKTDIYVISGWGNSATDKIHLSNGDGTFQVADGINSKISDELDEAQRDISRVNFGDFNGDGLTDIYYINGLQSGLSGHRLTGSIFSLVNSNILDLQSSSSENFKDDIFINKGDGTFEKRVGLETHIGYGVSNSSLDIARLKFIDFNSDGITDIYYVRGEDNRRVDYIYLFNSDGEYQRVEGINSEIGSLSDNAKRARRDVNRFMFGDFDGNGSIDIYHIKLNTRGSSSIFLKGPGTPQVDEIYLSHQQQPRLKTIIAANGNTTHITYKSLADVETYQKDAGAIYPFVDAQSTRFVVAKVTTENSASASRSVNYEYRGLKYKVRGRGSLGFREIIEHYEFNDKTTITTFDQRPFPYTGQVTSVEEQYQNERINIATNSVEGIEIHPGVFQLQNRYSEHRSYELGLPENPIVKVKTRNSNYDAYGNIGKIVVQTFSSDNDTPQIKTTISEYQNNTYDWFLGRLTQAFVTHQDTYGDSVSRLTTFDYSETTGLLTDESIIGAQSGNVLTHTKTTYDDYGLVVRKETQALNAEAARSQTFEYDTEGRLTQSCNTLDQCSNQNYNAQGWLASTTSINGVITQRQYDSLGRLTLEERDDGTSTQIQHHFANAPECGEPSTSMQTCTVTISSGSSASIIQYDAMGREVRRIKTGFDGRLIYSDTEYNAAGLVSRVSRDYYAGDTVYWATSEYDAMDRITRVTEPGPNGYTNESITIYDGLTSTSLSGPDARIKTTTKNASGQILRIDESDTFVEYTYTSDGNLASTTTNGNPATTITLQYDEFGRKTVMQDPDMGEWHYTYNGFGEITSQTDAKQQTIHMHYDTQGRMIRRITPEGVSRWAYGTEVNGIESVGKLVSESIDGIQKFFRYDSFGRNIETETRIDGHPPFFSGKQYDENGRVYREFYPGDQGFYTQNVYNEYGYLIAVAGDRGSAEHHSYDQLAPLIQQGLTLAEHYLSRAEEYRALSDYYQSKISHYQNLAVTVNIESDLAEQLTQQQHMLESTLQENETIQAGELSHINDALLELQSVVELLNSEATDYNQIAEQLIVLTEQTLATADHSFQIEKALLNTAQAYQDLIDGNDENLITYWRALDMDASGRISAEVYGNGIATDYAYNQATGQLQSIHAAVLATTPLRHLEYQYDGYQNVTLRHDRVSDIRESFQYDELERLTATEISSQQYSSEHFNQSHTLTYDSLGNIKYKSDVGFYHYDSASPHAVTSTTFSGTEVHYQYDANGNMTQGKNRSIAWNSLNKPIHIQSASNSVTFSYDANNSRYKKTNHAGDETLYIGLYEQTKKANGSTTQAHFIYAAGTRVAEHIVSNEHGTQTRYLHRDALGSIDLITNTYAEVADRRSFDAWGKIRELPWQQTSSANSPFNLSSLQLPFTNRGYTDHEHIQEVHLIHMNGRLYNAELARFISADPHIQMDAISQNYNRYSYVMNNPMKYSDPSGYFIKKLFSGIARAFGNFVQKFGPTVISVGACVFGGPVACAGMNAALSYITTGDLGAAVLSGITSFATAQISGAIGQANEIFGPAKLFDIGRSFAHGTVGGIVSVLQGSKFGQGFASAFFTKMVSGSIHVMSHNIASTSGINANIVGAISTAMVGGTASVIGGGKFANGAQTAMVQYLFNQAAEDLKNQFDTRQKLEDMVSRIKEIYGSENSYPYGHMDHNELSRHYTRFGWAIPSAPNDGAAPLDVAMALAVRDLEFILKRPYEPVIQLLVDVDTGATYLFDIDLYLNQQGTADLINTGLDHSTFYINNWENYRTTRYYYRQLDLSS